MKKFGLLIAAVVIILSLVGCRELSTVNNVSKETKSVNVGKNIENNSEKNVQLKSEDESKNEDNLASNNKFETIKIGWEFRNFNKIDGKDANGENIVFPYTEVFLLVKGKEDKKISVGSYIGNAQEIEDFTIRDLPPATKIACQSYYAGGGDDLCVFVEDNKIHVKWKPVDEVGPDVQGYVQPEFKDIKVIDIPKNAIVESINNKIKTK